jgi:hypothetical protein
MFHDLYKMAAPKNYKRKPINTTTYKYVVFEATPTPSIFSLVATINLLLPSFSHGMQAKIKMKNVYGTCCFLNMFSVFFSFSSHLLFQEIRIFLRE